MENELMVQNQALSLIDSVDIGAIQATMQKISTFQAAVQTHLKKDHDYGVVAGAGSKPTLLKPGGEKICMMFGINPEYEFLEKTEDYKEMFFTYNIKCTLYRNGSPVSQGVGNCNSKESKYAYANSDTLPDNMDPSMCEKKVDRYGRTKYKIPNPKIADLVNTILKMAKKRAFIDAVLQVASLSDVFTQDLEDMKDFINQENNAAAENMTVEDARNIKVSFGKYKGKTLGELQKEDVKYLTWLHDNSKDQLIAKAAFIVLDSKPNEVHKENSDQFEGTPFQED